MQSEDGKIGEKCVLWREIAALWLNAATVQSMQFSPAALRIFRDSSCDFPPCGQPATLSPAEFLSLSQSLQALSDPWIFYLYLYLSWFPAPGLPSPSPPAPPEGGRVAWLVWRALKPWNWLHLVGRTRAIRFWSQIIPGKTYLGRDRRVSCWRRPFPGTRAPAPSAAGRPPRTPRCTSSTRSTIRLCTARSNRFEISSWEYETLSNMHNSKTVKINLTNFWFYLRTETNI